MAVNEKFWQSWPVAPREQKFNADDAIARIMQWSGGSATKFNSAFLWRNSEGQPQNPESYRLPIADVIEGRLTLIPRAVFSAAVILSGGHGGLEGVVDEDEREELKNVLNQIYAELQAEYQDPRVRPPWLLGRTVEEREEDEEKMAVEASLFDGSDDPIGRGVWNGPNVAVNADWSGLAAAAEKHPWDGDAARHRVWDWADGDYRKFRRAFLWADPARPEQKNSYKLPVADVVDGELRIIPRAVSAAAALLAGARTSIDIPDRDMDDVEAVVSRLKNMEVEDSVTAAAPVRPPYQWFMEPIMNGPEPLTVSADGQVRGLIASFNRCHAGIMDECVMAPRSATGYKYFLNGQVMTADGRSVKVGKITMGTGHAGPNMRWMPAADHYDNTGTAAAVVNVGENAYGIWAAGSVVSSMTEEQIQELRRSPISGDWRRVDGSLELVAALAVNTPGFPIVASINGEPQSILAAGVMMEDGTVHASAEPQELSEVEKDMTRRVDELDDKLTQLAIRGRGRRLAKVLAALDERKK